MSDDKNELQLRYNAEAIAQQVNVLVDSEELNPAVRDALLDALDENTGYFEPVKLDQLDEMLSAAEREKIQVILADNVIPA